MMARTERKAVPGLWIAGLKMVTDMNIRGPQLQRTFEQR